MIERISIRNFAVARELDLTLAPGLTVFTGETGAGKSIIVDALAFVFGGRSGREVIAHGSDRAVVTVELAGQAAKSIERSVGLAGRSSARLDGAAATLEDLRIVAESAVDIHGQSEQLALLKPATQLRVLDSYGGLDALRGEVSDQVRELRNVRRRITALQTDAHERARLVDRLSYESEEIRSAALVVGEDERLRAEQRRLSGADALRKLASRATAALDAASIQEAASALSSIASQDESAGHLADTAALLQSTSGDALRAVRTYADALEPDPARLADITERLDTIARLKRKYGATIEAILQYSRDAEAELAALGDAETSEEALREREAALLAQASELAGRLSSARRTTAARLVAETERELHALGMDGATLAVGFESRDAGDGLLVSVPDYDRVDAAWASPTGSDNLPRAFSESGVDQVEFLASFNPGTPPRQLAAVASGGETSRFLLALTGVFGTAAEPRTIVLDEVDEGVGGRAGASVGEALARLAQRHQVLCITHLPQVAAFAARHFVVRKATDGQVTWSSVEPVASRARVEELAEMLGGASDETRSTAEALLTQAR